MIRVNVNLIGFSSNKSVGTLIYTKRLFRQIFENPPQDIKFVFYAQELFDFSDFKLPQDSEIIRVPNMANPFVRRIYEHTVFRFKLKSADYLFTPHLTVPLFITNMKQIVIIHDMVPFKVGSKYGKLKLSLLKFESKQAARMAYKILTVSYNSKHDICDITKINANKVEVIYNFITKDEKVIVGKKNDSYLLSYNLTKPYFITVATLQPGKNIELLIEAFSTFIKDNPDYQLCIVGNKGWGFNNIYKVAQDLGVEKDVVFTGYADDETLDALYTSCFGVVYVSLYEGFGIPPLEGFYHGKAAITSNNSSLPEVVGDAAVMVNPRDVDSIASGFSDFIQKKSELEKNTSKQKEKFSPNIIVEKFLNVIRL